MQSASLKRMLVLCLVLTLAVSFAPPLVPSMEAAQAPPGARPDRFSKPVRSLTLDKQRARGAYLKLPLYFIANQGQLDESVGYYVQGGEHGIYFTAEEMVMALDETVLRMRFVGAKATPPLGVEQRAAKVNYFIGSDPAKWQTDIPTYGEVVYHDLYPGIELRYGGQTGALKYTFVVQPGTDVSQIRLAYGGAAGLRLDEEGNLLILAGGSELKDTKPYAYQEIGGRRVEVDVAFVLHGVRTYGFAVRSDYDPHYPLVIDPTLQYSTYLGGISDDWGYGIAVDGAGRAYVTGGTRSTNFPTQNAYQGAHAGGVYRDVFVTKLDTAGNALLYSTYLGGSDKDEGWGIAVDGIDQAYVTGLVKSTDFPTQNPYDNSLGGSKDAFVTKLNAAGNALLYSTYLGGDNKDEGFAIAVDGAGQAYVTGYAKSANFPTKNAYQDECAGCPDHNDAFVTKLNATGNALVYSTYLGGLQGAAGYAIAVDGIGQAYVTGRTGTKFPIYNAYQWAYGGGGSDVFVTKLFVTGNALVYSTYLGGEDNDWSFGIAVDGAGSAYVTGATRSSDFPVQNAYQTTKAGGDDAFVTKFDPSGVLLYSTYLGGEGDDCEVCCAIAVDGAGNAYVTGHTDSIGFPIQNAYQPIKAGFNDAFVTKLNATGNALLYSTYLGGIGNDWGYGIAVDGAGNIYVTGLTESANFPTQNPYQGVYGGGGRDAFVAKFSEERPDLSTSSKQVDPVTIVPTGTVTHTLSYTIILVNTGNQMATTAYLTDTLPANLALAVNPACPGGGTCSYNAPNHTVTWRGSLAISASVVVTYAGLVNVPIDTADTFYFVNTARVDDGTNAPFTLTARSAVNPNYSYLPLIQKR